MKTANEEALSSMEELQSTNEELETAKEELQSSNEELVTLNDQLQVRNSELSRMSDDLSNILNLVDVPILILDRDRWIRRFTPPAADLLGLLASDLGRPIRYLRFGVDIPDLENLVAAVSEKGTDVSREVRSETGRWYLLSMRPFRTGGERIEGVLMSFVDIDKLKRNQESLQTERNFIAAILDAAKDLLFAQGYDPNFGARPLKRAIQKLIQDPLALKILDGDVLHGDHVVVDADKKAGKMTFKVSGRVGEKAPARAK